MKQLIKYATGLEEALDFPPLSILERYKFVDHLVAGETPQLVAVCARRKIEWVNSLDFACYLELTKGFIRENFPMAMQIATADPIAGMKVGPLLLQMSRALASLENTSASAPGPSSSPTPNSDAPSGDNSPPTAAPADAAALTAGTSPAAPLANSGSGSAPMSGNAPSTGST